eukprot:3925832-Pyramimonas_sp.AAC.1
MQVKLSVRRDRAEWLEHLLATGDWGQVCKLRKGFAPKVGWLRDSQGGLVDSDARQETMADYLSSVQWAARNTTPMQAAMLGPALPVEVGLVQEWEVVEAAKAMKWEKACGSDAIPGDFWKAICCRDSPARAWA